MGRDFLRRSHVLVVCGKTVDESMKNDIAVAERLRITATTLGRHTYRQGAGPRGKQGKGTQVTCLTIRKCTTRCSMT